MSSIPSAALRFRTGSSPAAALLLRGLPLLLRLART
jgi:hypothetical protein